MISRIPPVRAIANGLVHDSQEVIGSYRSEVDPDRETSGAVF